jgi:tape measure domain-containing protein
MKNIKETARFGEEKDLEGIFRAFSQIKRKDKVEAEEINQIAERLPIIRRIMTEIFGTADPDKLQKMGITADEFFEKVTERLKEMPKARNGLGNAIGNIGDALKIAAFDTGAIKSTTNYFTRLSPEVQKLLFAVTGLVFVVGALVDIFYAIVSLITMFLAGFAVL